MMNHSSSTSSVLNLIAARWEVKPWELQEYAHYRVRVLRSTEKAYLLADDTAGPSRTTWMPKSAVNRQELAPWAGRKLREAGFRESAPESNSLRG